MNDQIKEKLKELPDLPGVYIMKNQEDEIIYVGKAISLKRRVRQYFDNNKNKDRKVLAMVSHIDHFEYIIVENEVEALILESNLIKKNRPKYNIVLRDDKQYPYIKITREKFPRVQKVRHISNDKAMYFGPYPDAYAVNDTIELLHSIYRIRTCNLNFDKGQKLDRPCLNYFIKRCNAPCIGNESEERYMKDIEEIRLFLENKSDKIPNLVLEKMNSYSKNLEFEQAAKYRDYYRALSVIGEKQNISRVNEKDSDIIALSRGNGFSVMQVFLMRSGKIVDRQHFILNDLYRESNQELMSSFLKQYYLDIMYIPKEILLQVEPTDFTSIESFLNQKKGQKVRIYQPKLGNKKDLVNMAFNNAHDMMVKHEISLEKREGEKNLGLKQLKELLNIEDLSRIECFDISNTSGVQSVGSMVVFEDGKANRKEYRKFKIKTVEGPDDYASHREVLTRRFTRAVEDKDKTETGFGKIPNLIFMDGGKGQVSVAKEVIDKFGFDIEIAGLVKDDKHITRAIIYQGREIFIKKSDPAYKFIYKIQEEAHRFAINYHRKLMSNSLEKSELDNIKGVGKKTKANLFRHFKTINNIKKASIEDLMEVDLVGKKQALEIYKYFRLKK
jgi:excinuclease ABC subunit C